MDEVQSIKQSKSSTFWCCLFNGTTCIVAPVHDKKFNFFFKFIFTLYNVVVGFYFSHYLIMCSLSKYFKAIVTKNSYQNQMPLNLLNDVICLSINSVRLQGRN